MYFGTGVKQAFRRALEPVHSRGLHVCFLCRIQEVESDLQVMRLAAHPDFSSSYEGIFSNETVYFACRCFRCNFRDHLLPEH